MAIKKYHVSRNLFDEDYTGATNLLVYKPIYTGVGNYTLSSTIPIVNNATNIFLIAGTASSGASTANNGVWADNPRTVTAIDGYITIVYRASSTSNPNNPADYNTMLNTGNTALPYEPYGNTWVEIPYRKYDTETDTLTTLPAEVIADGNNATVGLVGNMSQSGTPSPSSIIMPSECGERTAQLINPLTATYGKYIDNNGVEQTSATGYSNHSDYIRIEAGETYTLSYSKPQIGSHTAAIAWYTENKTFIIRSYEPMPTGEGRYSFTTQAPNNAAYAISNFSYFEAYTQEQNENNYILSKGSELLPYEPYGIKIPILSANTTTPVYLGEVESTRKIKKYEFTGQESDLRIQASITATNAIQLPTTLSDYKRESFVCSHMPIIDSSANPNTHGFAGQFLTLCFDLSMGLDTLEKVRTYLQQQYAAGTPVTVWYVLATPTTGIVNEPIRKIGDYVDTVSGISIPTLSTADTFDVGTTLKPSEVSLSYTGWHDAEVKEWDGSEWQ